MIDFLKFLFKTYLYELVNEGDDLFFFRKNSPFSDFWIVTSTFPDDIEDNWQDEIFQSSKRVFEGCPEAEKNMSLLVLKETDRISPFLADKIIAMENDTSYFKKYVIVYSDEDFCEFKENFDSWNGSFDSFLMDRDVFQHLKNESSEYGVGPYHLAYSFAHKLPFLRLSPDSDSVRLESNEVELPENLKEIYDWAVSSNSIQEDEIVKYIDYLIDKNG